jgi:hypothetical protein
LETEIAKFAKWGAKLTAYKEFLETFDKYHALCLQKMMDAKVDMTSNMPTKFVIENAIPADKKVYPQKIVIMITATVAVFFLFIFSLLVYENIQKQQAILRKQKEDLIR